MMSGHAAAAGTPAAVNATLACGNAECRKALAPPLLQCSKCKGEAYCCKACQVGDPACPRHALRAARAGARSCPLTRTRTRTLSPSLSLPPPDCRVEGRAQAQVRRAGAGRGGGEAEERRAGGGRAWRGRARAGGADRRAEPTGDEVVRAARRRRLAGRGGAREGGAGAGAGAAGGGSELGGCDFQHARGWLSRDRRALFLASCLVLEHHN